MYLGGTKTLGTPLILLINELTERIKALTILVTIRQAAQLTQRRQLAPRGQGW